MSLHNQASVLFAMEGLVRKIQHKKLKLDEWVDKNTDAFISDLPDLLAQYRLGYDYGEHIEAFWRACQSMGLLDMESGIGVSHGFLEFQSSTWRYRVVRELIEKIYENTLSKRFTRRLGDRGYEARERKRNLEEYVQNILSHYARVLVLRIDFGYYQSASVDIDEFYGHRDYFLSQLQARKGVFTNAIGYAWCMEQGKDKSYHIHFALLLPGRQHQSDGLLSQQCGELWKFATDGKGIYHNCNAADKEKYESMGRRGIGMINRENPQECENCVKALGYLTEPEKDDQYLRMKPKHRRTYGAGVFTGKQRKKRGSLV